MSNSKNNIIDEYWLIHEPVSREKYENIFGANSLKPFRVGEGKGKDEIVDLFNEMVKKVTAGEPIYIKLLSDAQNKESMTLICKLKEASGRSVSVVFY